MFWDGTHWVDEAPSEAPPSSRRRARDWLATAAMVLVLAGLLVPFAGVSAATLPGNRLIAQWSASHDLVTYQETSRRITYRGTWVRAYNPGYLGDRARSANRRGSRATFRFSGTAVSWIGPVGPSRGQARVYLNGRLVKTVNTYARSFKPSQVLFTATFSTMATRTLTIVVVGSRGHPKVAIDAFAVRGKQRVTTGAGTRLAPTATAAPTPTPASTTGFAVPSSIDATGGSDASAALNTWLRTVPDGSTVVFKAGAVYRMDRALMFSSRHSLRFEGNGATLRSNGVSTCGRDCSLFYLWTGNSGIVIRNFTLIGNSPTPGVFNATWEHTSAITIVAGGTVEIANITVSGVGGDGLTLSGVAPYWPDGIWFHDSRVISSGRMGVAVVAGRNVTVERVRFDTIGYGAFDIEPNDTTQGASNVKFLNNTVGSIGMPRGQSFLFGANGATGSAISDVTVSGNTISGDGLDTYVNIATRRQNIVFINNTSTSATVGAVLYLSHIDGLTVAGNVQPLTSGVLASITDSTGVTYP